MIRGKGRRCTKHELLARLRATSARSWEHGCRYGCRYGVREGFRSGCGREGPGEFSHACLCLTGAALVGPRNGSIPLSQPCIPCATPPTRAPDGPSEHLLPHIPTQGASPVHTHLMALLNTCCPTRASKADSGSSSSTTSALAYSARAMAMRCFWPPDTLVPRSPGGGERDARN